MATWIVHLRIAENLLRQFPELSPSGFAVGNIAPDSGIPDEKWGTFNPPTEVTHLQPKDDKFANCRDLVFFRTYLEHTTWRLPEIDRTSFLWGYFCHLVTDNLWRMRIAEPAMKKHADQFAADPEFIWEVKKDWYGLDFEYVRTHPESIYWEVFLTCDYPVNYLDFLLPEGVKQRIDCIKEFYQKSDPEIEEMVSKQREYLTGPEMDAFVDDATRMLSKCIGLLKKQKTAFEGMVSIMEMTV